jgi:hypothetical protein
MAPKTKHVPNPKLEEVLADKETKTAFDFLISKNASPGELWSHLGPAIAAAYIPRSGDMLAVQGMTRRDLQAFPASIRRTARSIRLIDEHFILESKGSTKAEVGTLVGLLLRYADRLESFIEFYRGFMAKNPSYWNLKSIFLLRLLDYVKKTTGEDHLKEVATLLAGGFDAVDKETTIDIDPDALRKLLERRSPAKKPRRLKRVYSEN